MAKRDGEEAVEDREDGHGDDGDEDGYQARARSQAGAEHLKHGGPSIQLLQWPRKEGASHSHVPEPRVTPGSVELHTPHSISNAGARVWRPGTTTSHLGDLCVPQLPPRPRAGSVS